VQFLQIVERAGSCADHVAAAIVPPVLLHPEILAGGRDELPDAGGAAGRICTGIEGAFYYRQQGDFAGHAAPFHLGCDVVKIAARAIGHARHVVGVVDIPFLMFGDEGAVKVAHGKTIAYAFPQVSIRDDLQFDIARGRKGQRSRRIG
jgi:hypothetical protein